MPRAYGRCKGPCLPEAECRLGYTRSQVKRILADHGRDEAEFNRWMAHQTRSICDGREYSHATKTHSPACGGVAHGSITYPWDVERFLARLPVID